MRELCIITGGAGGIGLAAVKIAGRQRVDIACGGGVLAAFTMRDMIAVARNTPQLQ